MAGTLFVVATPIGHLEDISARALRILRDVAIVAAEDTRRTGNLLRHFSIPTRILSLHEHNERSRAPELVARLRRGESVALVSDAGTPGVSDPGAELVRMAREAGIAVVAVPGPSAVATAISLAGLEDPEFAFLGFPPIRSKDRIQWIERLVRYQADLAVVCFEAPHRIRKTLEDLVNYVKQPILVFRELTKLHEECLTGLPGEILGRLEHPQGEFTLVFPRTEPAETTAPSVSVEALRHELGLLTNNDARSKREAARLVARKFGLSSQYVYDARRD
ncbi:MAG: 16S rRNA (cytidine(1402)-2'-O)-methyltransferase [Vicinamibacterales bacterium]